jgi:hypothetical protein
MKLEMLVSWVVEDLDARRELEMDVGVVGCVGGDEGATAKVRRYLVWNQEWW